MFPHYLSETHLLRRADAPNTELVNLPQFGPNEPQNFKIIFYSNFQLPELIFFVYIRHFITGSLVYMCVTSVISLKHTKSETRISIFQGSPVT